MKAIPFDESALDVWHDASVEVPDSSRTVLASNNRTIETNCRVGFSWLHGRTPEYWRELPAPPKPTPKIVEYSTNHWHDPKVERPEPGRKFVVMCTNRTIDWFMHKSPDWDAVAAWTYCPETTK